MSKYFTRSLSGLAATRAALLAACRSKRRSWRRQQRQLFPGSPHEREPVRQHPRRFGSTRIEIELLAGGLGRARFTSRRMTRKKIVSRVAAIDTVARTVTTTLGGMRVSYGTGTGSGPRATAA
ncbi:MAG: hypothetical protein IPI92_17520 [Gemmatimonadetes bacterium]|nr:hypothetical protein [Gemmatimonadota bacterium]